MVGAASLESGDSVNKNPKHLFIISIVRRCGVGADTYLLISKAVHNRCLCIMFVLSVITIKQVI